MTKTVLLLCTAVTLSMLMFSDADSSSPQIFSQKDKKQLRTGGPMTFVYMKGKGNAMSNLDDAAGFLNISALPSGWDRYDVVIVEKAYLKVKPDVLTQLKIFNTMTGRTGLKGMKYYSISESGLKSLVLESFSVRSCGERTYVSDETVTAIPAKSESFFVIKDNRLGTICFSGTVEYRDGMFIETDVSCGRVSRLGLSVFNDGGYVIKHYIVPDDSGGGYFYCSVQIMKVESSIMKKLDLLNPENFANRARGETVHFFRRMGYDLSGHITAFR